MKLFLENKNIKCDSVNCNKTAISTLDINSYKGIIFLCEDCLKQLQSILKTNSKKEQKQQKEEQDEKQILL